MDTQEKQLTLNYLQSLMELKKSDLGDLIETLNQIYAGQSGVSLVTCVSELYSRVSEIGEISNQIEDLRDELDDFIPNP